MAETVSKREREDDESRRQPWSRLSVPRARALEWLTVPSPEAARRCHIAIVDDDESLNRSLVLHLEEQGCRVSSFFGGATALAALKDDLPDLVLLDVRLKDLDGIDVLRELKQRSPEMGVVMITAFHETDVTVEASRLGAFDYLPKPLSLDKLDAVVERALSRRAELRAAPSVPSATDGEATEADRSRMVGSSAAMLEVFKTIGMVAGSDAGVLVLGESGTGKEMVARTIHHHSKCAGPFLSVNCAMLSPEFLASELFGHEKGAFTGAVARRQGVFELADQGTLLLDEVSEMDLPIQARLLRVLQEREFNRLGGNETIRTDVRVIAASNRDLEGMARNRTFREDLYFRLAVVPIRLPPLRERKGDIPLLVDHILKTRVPRTPGRAVRLSPGAIQTLVSYPWPGNVRELENVLIRASLQAKGAAILATDLDLTLRETGAESTAFVERSLEDVERAHIAAVLDHTGGSKAQAVRILGISRPTLDKKLRRYDIKIGRVVIR